MKQSTSEVVLKIVMSLFFFLTEKRLIEHLGMGQTCNQCVKLAGGR